MISHNDVKKRFWYISKYAISPNYGNPSRQYFISKYLQREGFSVTLVFSRASIFLNQIQRKYEPRISVLDNFRQVMLDGPNIDLGFSWKRIWSWIDFEVKLFIWMWREREVPDVILVSSLSILTFITGVWAKYRYKAKLLIEVRDIYPYTLVSTGVFSAKHPAVLFLGIVEKLAYKHADFIISTLPLFDRHLMKVSPNAVSKFRYIPMGFDPEYYSVSHTEDKDISCMIPKNKFIVAYVGSFGKTQATGVIFEVIRRTRFDNSIFFILAGDGPEKEKGLKLISGQDNFIDIGKIDKQKAGSILKNCHVALNPWLNLDLYDYGISPNKWIDYMNAELPFIVCHSGASISIESANCASVIQPECPEALVTEIIRFRDMPDHERIAMGKRGKDYLHNNLSYQSHAVSIRKLME